MAVKPRLDAELVRRGLARSRHHAAELIGAGRVRIAGIVATKPATGVDPQTSLVVEAETADGPPYVSRGATKLLGALAAFPDLVVAGRRALDAGASTGGFTDVLLRQGASHVLAVDVGYGQLAWRLRTDPRVTVVERTNVRTLPGTVVSEPVDLVVADLSFISLTLVVRALAACTVAGGDLLVMVKPQFEAGKEAVGAGGVVRDPVVRTDAVRGVAAAGVAAGLGVRGVAASPLPGPAGNIEYFLWMRAGAPGLLPADVDLAIVRAVEEGPA